MAGRAALRQRQGETGTGRGRETSFRASQQEQFPLWQGLSCFLLLHP